MRVVVDTNTLISALLWQGSPYKLFLSLRADNGIELFTSPVLLAELADVLTRPHLNARLLKINQSPENLLADIARAFVVIRPTPLTQPVCRDPDDDEVLACALTARANFIVSGDTDLLVLKTYEGIDILNAAQAISRIECDGK
jgi:uncharacterized protein